MKDAQDIQVVVADPLLGHRLLVELELMIQPDMRLVGQAADGPAAAELCERLRPDVAVIDLHLLCISGAELAPLIRRLSPDTRVLLWSGESHPRAFAATRELGAQGQVAKHAAGSEIVAAIRRLAELRRPAPSPRLLPTAAPC